MNIVRSYLNCCTIVNWKIRKRFNNLKGSLGAGGFFLKTYRASLFNEDLSNEPNFGRIHLAGQYLQHLSVSPNLPVSGFLSACLHLLVSMSARLSILSVLSLGLLYLEVGSVIVSIWVEERFPGLEWKLISWNNRNNLLHPHSCPGTRAHSHWGRLQLSLIPRELCSTYREGISVTHHASNSTELRSPQAPFSQPKGCNCHQSSLPDEQHSKKKKYIERRPTTPDPWNTAVHPL